MTTFRQLEQRYISSEILLMEWNPMLDLIALATINGEVILNRLSWQKVWSLFPPGSTKEQPILVTAMAWRPDGKILAYAYDTGIYEDEDENDEEFIFSSVKKKKIAKIALVDVENSETIHELDIKCKVVSLKWVENGDEEKTEDIEFYKDRSAEFLQKLYSINKTYDSTSKQVEEVSDDFKKMKNQKNLNILAIGMENGIIHLYSFGIFPSGYLVVNIEPDISTPIVNFRVLSLSMSEDFKILTVFLEVKESDEKYSYHFKTYSLSLFHENRDELKVVALKYGQISSLLTYLSATLRSISEAWEDILLEIDTKIHNYAEAKWRKSEDSLSDDFLELLLFGMPSDALEKFLLHDLTESGLKKFGHSIEMSYSNIQKLILKRLQNVITSLFYNLNDLKGMAMWTERFGPLGFSESSVKNALFSVGSFLLKAMEIQQVIDNSMKNFKAFFRWMYAVILRLSDEPIPHELSKVTQQDLNFVGEFLKENFVLKPNQEKKSIVKLERVAQYLKKENLTNPVKVNGNPWHTFLDDHPIIKHSDMIFPYYQEKSLFMQYIELRKLIDHAIKGPWNVLKDTAKLLNSYVVFRSETSSSYPQISDISCSSHGYIYTAITNESPPSTYLYIIRESDQTKSIEALGISFNNIQFSSSNTNNEKCINHKILDAKFYDNETITVLLLESSETEYNNPILLQMPLKSVIAQMKSIENIPGELISSKISILDAGSLIEKVNFKKIDNVKASKIAVSGSRKVVCVLFSSKRQVRLFEMDAEEEECESDHEDGLLKEASSPFENEDSDNQPDNPEGTNMEES